MSISPKGSITFIRQLCTGSRSDREMVEHSSFFKLPFEQGDSVMADKGFSIEDVLLPWSAPKQPSSPWNV